MALILVNRVTILIHFTNQRFAFYSEQRNGTLNMMFRSVVPTIEVSQFCHFL